MSKPNTRPTRSRISSPFVSGPLTNAALIHGNGQEPAKQKTFLDKWVEPALPAPRPSFAEAGLERHGVVANMAPLGTRPTGKILKGALRLEGEGSGRGGRKSRGATPAIAAVKEARNTPESAAQRSEDAEKITAETMEMQEPEQVKSAETTSPLNQSQATQGDRAKGQQAMPILAPSPPVDSSQQPSTPQRPSTSTSVPATPVTDDLKMSQTDQIVEIAVQEAVDEKRWPTAFALRTLYDDTVSTQDKQLIDLFEAVSTQTADRAQLDEFHSRLKARKQMGKRHLTAEYYFLGDGNDPVSAQPHPPSTPSGKRPITPRVTRSSRQSSVNHVASTHPSHEHVSKKRKGNNAKPAKLQLNGHASGSKEKEEPATPKENGILQQDSDSGSNSSPLSSVDEKVLDKGYADSPAPPAPPHVSEETQRRLQSITSAIAGTAPHKFVSPYANAQAFNAQAFAATAETLAGYGHADPITQRTASSPKTSSTSPAPARPHPSSSTSRSITAEEHRDPPSPPSSDPLMAPSATTTEHLLASNGHAKADASDELPSESHRKEEDLLALMKKKARQTTEMSVVIEESFVRGVPTPVSQEEGSPSESGDPFTADPSRRPTKVRLFNREAKQKYNYDSEDLSSPTFLDFRQDLAPGSITTSRAGTPASTRPTRKAKTGSGLRVKTSPMKKKGALAGMPRASGERNSPVANGVPNNQDENDDYCSACGGNGALVCCDTCPRSFHFKCVDPPIDETSLPDEEWFCNLCASSRRPRLKVDAKGTFGHLLANLERKNPSAFHLPHEVRDYFVDVKTGTEGEYEEIIAQRPKKAGGYDEIPDHFRLKDAKGNTILCHQCNGMASAPDRAIITCTYCPISWHLDCIPVPMANPPVVGKSWRCPSHVDDLLAEIPGTLRPAHRFRRIKGIPPIEPALSRGIRNNGHIEIQNEPEDPEEQGFFEFREYGKIYKLPELGIKLDFITKVRESTGGGYASAVNHKLKQQRSSNRTRSRTISEQQAALNLVSLASQSSSPGPSSLYDTLLVEAPKAVLDMVAQGDAENIQAGRCTERDRHSLLALRALIDARLSVPSDLEGRPAASSDEPFEKQETNDVEMSDR